MSGNSTSTNLSGLHPHISSNDYAGIYCIITPPGSFIFTAFNAAYILLLLPLYIFILHHGLQLWRQKKRSTSSAVTVSHSDCFTYHMVIMELVGVCGCFLSFFAIYNNNFGVLVAGLFLFSFTWFGQILFHVLTCVERYLAVVHPITYLSLRNQRGIRIRNISIACVWLVCLAGMGLVMRDSFFVVWNICFLSFSLIVISFCSVSVLRVLIRPGPGEQGGGRERVDQSKQRAFYTITAILGVLVLKFAWGLVWTLLYLSAASCDCVIMVCQIVFNLLGSLVLPLLFLHRAGKLVCCKKNIRSGHD